MIGAGQGMPWLGLVVVPPVLVGNVAFSPHRKADAFLVLAAGALGFCFDSLLIYAGIFRPVPYLLPLPLSPPWMVLLWMNFASVLNVSLQKLHGRYLLSAVLGSMGGPAAYYGGAGLGAIPSTFDTGDLLVLSAAWAGAVPSLFWIAARINKKYT